MTCATLSNLTSCKTIFGVQMTQQDIGIIALMSIPLILFFMIFWMAIQENLK